MRDEKHPRIPVITPVYNMGDSIGDSIRSARAQGYPDFEHIVVDDGSTDGTLEVVRKYPHVTLVDGARAGLSAAMNRASMCRRATSSSIATPTIISSPARFSPPPGCSAGTRAAGFSWRSAGCWMMRGTSPSPIPGARSRGCCTGGCRAHTRAIRCRTSISGRSRRPRGAAAPGVIEASPARHPCRGDGTAV